MKLEEAIPTIPISVEKSLRRDEQRVLTSGNAGKILPIAYVPLLREDRVTRSNLRVRLEMMETAELLMNAVNVNVYAHFIPHLAFERFNGMDQYNRSYKGVPEVEGETPIPFFETRAYNRNDEIYKVMGIHAKQGDLINTGLLESYNLLVNYRRKARSAKLGLRDRLDTSLASAFWHHTGMRHIVPDFDQAMIDGEVTGTVSGEKMPVQGLGVRAGLTHARPYVPVREADGIVRSKRRFPGDSLHIDSQRIGSDYFPDVFVEMEQVGISVSLSNIELAKKTAAFAKLRNQYSGLDDDHIIDLLMEAVRVPEEQMSQPILLSKKSTIMGYNRRYATDGANLDESVTTGETFVDLTLRTPPMNTGGIILVTCEITPEQLFERQKDYYIHSTKVVDVPNFTRDFLDPEKVSVVQNSHVDVDHDTPDETFGYAPLNHEWQRSIPNIGGKYFRPTVDASFDEDRQKIWAVETENPTLTEDFYLTNELHHKVFSDTEADAFEIMAVGHFDIVGNTVFGKGLVEATDDYDKILEDVDATRIDQTDD